MKLKYKNKEEMYLKNQFIFVFLKEVTHLLLGIPFENNKTQMPFKIKKLIKKKKDNGLYFSKLMVFKRSNEKSRVQL